jgi:hypothetical protein
LRVSQRRATIAAVGTLGTIVVVVFGLLVVWLCVVLGLRHSRRSIEQLRDVVLQYGATLREVSERTGLELQLPEPYQHPLMGAVPGWPSLLGTITGFDVALEIECEGGDSPVTVRTWLRLRCPGQQFRIPGSRSTFRLPRDEDKLRALTPLAAEVSATTERLELTATEVAMRVRPASKQPRAAGYELKLPLDAGSLARLVDAGVALVKQLAVACSAES